MPDGRAAGNGRARGREGAKPPGPRKGGQSQPETWRHRGTGYGTWGLQPDAPGRGRVVAGLWLKCEWVVSGRGVEEERIGRGTRWECEGRRAGLAQGMQEMSKGHASSERVVQELQMEGLSQEAPLGPHEANTGSVRARAGMGAEPVRSCRAA